MLDCSWNRDLLDAYFHLDDVKIIRGIAISRTQSDRTKIGKDHFSWVLNMNREANGASGTEMD